MSVPADAVVTPEQAGTFAGYGVDVRVALSPGAGEAPGELPLCALITGWVRGRVDAQARAEVRVYSDDHDADAALDRGRRLRAEIDEAADPVGVLVVADGAHTLTPPAPGGYDPDSIPVQAALDDALAGGDAAALARLPETVVGRVAYQVLAGLADRRATVGQGALPRGALRRGIFRRRLAPDEAARDHRPDRHRQVGAGAGGGREAGRRRGVEIVNADAMQLYRGMDIGTAKLPVAERRGVPHHQLDVLDVTETATVARYQQDAAEDVERISAAGAVPIIVGGSMMYVQSLLDEWAFPATDPDVRAKWELRLAEIGARGAA